MLDIDPDSLRTSPDAWTVEVGLKPLLERSSFPSQETYKSFNEALTHAERATGDTRPTSLLNHPMQSHGAEMLRLACSFTTEAGIAVCAPVERALPPLKAVEEPLHFELAGKGLADQGRAVMSAAANGEIAPAQASTLLTALHAVARGRGRGARSAHRAA